MAVITDSKIGVVVQQVPVDFMSRKCASWAVRGVPTRVAGKQVVPTLYVFNKRGVPALVYFHNLDCHYNVITDIPSS